MILAPNFPDKKMREILFIKETSEEISIWEGNKLTKKEAQEISGIKTVMWNDTFENILNLILAESNEIYLDKNEHIRSSTKIQTPQDRFILDIQRRYSSYKIKRSYPILSDLRMIKDKTEINLIQMACDITEKGFRRILRYVEPGIWEFDIEAEFIHEFIKNRSKGFAYQPIIATGINACSLHYNENKTKCKSGELILMDVAAEYANYKSDMTRTIPVNGKFTNRQLEVYNAVLNVKNEATNILRPGISINDYHKEVGKIMESELIKIKLIDKVDVKNQDPKNPLFKKYFMHGTSHHIGLDVHDVGGGRQGDKGPERLLAHGMVLTVEPGLYFGSWRSDISVPERYSGIGIRIEDDVLVTDGGPIILTSSCPKEISDIEDLVGQKNE